MHTVAILGTAKTELHLCRSCAEESQLLPVGDPPNLPMALDQLVEGVIDLAKLRCPDCGTTYMQFRRTGRLGCPFDYVAFRQGLLPLLHRFHRGQRHVGKVPSGHPRPIEWDEEIREWRRQLRTAIGSEDFEEAARLRDMIRTKDERYDGR